MKRIGIIAEFNPFHNGHKYFIDEIKKKFNNSIIILIMSTTFTQRGDPSIINKWDKTTLALKYVDLVVELPYEFTVQSADDFSYASIKLLNELKVDYIFFGSESNDIKKIENMAKTQLTKEYKEKIKEEIKKGINYPSALNNILKDKINTPNDILALSYVREIIHQKANIVPFSIKRENNYHDKHLKNNIVSASAIRQNINNRKIKKYIPKDVYKYTYKNSLSIESYFDLLKYKIISEIDNLNIYHDVNEGIENKIKKEIYKSNTFDELIKNVKSKRYTYSRLKRMFIHILMGYTKEENLNKEIKYIRVLGFNNKGKNYLNKIKKEVNLPIYTNFKKNIEKELKYTAIYSSVLTKEKQNELLEKEIKCLIKL